MGAATILPDPNQVCLRTLVQERIGIRAVVATRATEATCPLCGQRSARVHSRYVRQVADVPWHGVPSHLELHVRRFFCDQSACPRQIVAERLPGVVAPYARRTVQLTELLTLVGFLLGGAAGARLAAQLSAPGHPASADTLLRLVRRTPVPAPPIPRVLSVDDFALQRGLRYATLLVDLERHRVVDLLPDREAETFAAWLRVHPGVEVVSRDRGGAYAEGARQGAPQALQVADRFHLLANLGTALDGLLTREHHALAQAAQQLQVVQRREPPQQHKTPNNQQATSDTTLPTAISAPPLPTPTTRAERAHAAAEARRQARYARVVDLHRDGHSLQAIARLAGLARNTVRRYLQSARYPEPAPRRRRVQACDPFADSLQQRWAAGERNSAVLLSELRAQGFTGSASTLCNYLMPWRPPDPCHPGCRRSGRRRTDADTGSTGGTSLYRPFSPRQTRWVLVRPLEELDPAQRAYRDILSQQYPPIATAQALVEDFWRLLRHGASLEQHGLVDLDQPDHQSDCCSSICAELDA